MSEHISKTITKAFNVFVLFALFLTACNYQPGATVDQTVVMPTPTSEAATPIPVTMETPVASPTVGFSWLSTATAGPTQASEGEAASTPGSSDWCKNIKTRTGTQSDVKIGGVQDTAFYAISCFVSVDGPLTELSAPGILVKIGFNDKQGVLHTYQAVIGGLTYKNAAPKEFQYPKCNSQNVQYYNQDDYIAYLKQFTGATAKEFPVMIFTALDLRYHWPPEASLVNQVKDMNVQLQKAIDTGDGFPASDPYYIIFIMPGLPSC